MLLDVRRALDGAVEQPGDIERRLHRAVGVGAVQRAVGRDLGRDIGIGGRQAGVARTCRRPAR